MIRALLLVDLQNDFFPGGALAVQEGDQILPLIRQLLLCPFDLIVATKDWHPANHKSFADNHAQKKPGDHVQLGGIDQILWPRHCVQESLGAEFVANWDTSKVNKIVHKGIDPDVDSYGAFFDNWYLKSTGLENYLNEAGVTDVYIAGVATDYCVKYSVFDALLMKLKTFVIIDACRAVNLRQDDGIHALKDMEAAGAKLITTQQVVKYFDENKKL